MQPLEERYMSASPTPLGLPPRVPRRSDKIGTAQGHLRNALRVVQAMLLAGDVDPLDAVADLTIVRDRLVSALEVLGDPD